jgi:hypothetical protein
VRRLHAGYSGITAAAVADTTTFTAGQAPGFLRCGGATQLHKINEVYVGGEDTASTPTTMILARTSTISVGALSVGTLALRDFNSTAPATAPSWGSTAATTFPQRSSTLYLLEPVAQHLRRHRSLAGALRRGDHVVRQHGERRRSDACRRRRHGQELGPHPVRSGLIRRDERTPEDLSDG